jgi:ABC-type iron transport system FetAB ATPase subunit
VHGGTRHRLRNALACHRIAQSGRSEHFPTGEKQRLGLVRALLLHSRVLLLDEPTSALDETSAASVEDIVAEVCPVARV